MNSYERIQELSKSELKELSSELHDMSMMNAPRNHKNSPLMKELFNLEKTVHNSHNWHD